MARLRQPAASTPALLRITPAGATAPPLPDEIELQSGQVNYALHQARGEKWGQLYQAFVS
ncbi:hypothetical protein GCM10028824_26500 [Hymenobacter segetis]